MCKFLEVPLHALARRLLFQRPMSLMMMRSKIFLHVSLEWKLTNLTRVAELAEDLSAERRLKSEQILRFREGWFASVTKMPPHQNEDLTSELCSELFPQSCGVRFFSC